MNITIALIALATFAATLIGGIFAIKFKDKLHLILGFSAGAVIGVAFFDLLPESLELGSKFHEPATITGFVALGFFTYLILDRMIFLHTHSHSHEENKSPEVGHKHIHRGFLGAGSLSIHSFLDGVAIGLAFQVSAAIGAIVAVAVLVHDFSDGINTVNLILKNSGDKKTAFKFLMIDALAPVLGVISTFFFSLPEQSLSVVLALFSGFFLYIGASDLIPESHHAHPKFMTTFMTLLGMAVLFIAIHIASF
jgi:ZIP family zinc transporter